MKVRIVLTVVVLVAALVCVGLFFAADEIYRGLVDVFVPMPTW